MFFSILLVILALSGINSQASKEWDDVDFEIFDLNDSLAKLRGEGTTFYDFLEIDSLADLKTISSAYRKISLKYHPDKVSGPEIEQVSKLLTSIAKILKNSESKSKYDAHLLTGFPVWRGSGYYYKKYRPGIGSVIVIIVLFISSVQYWSAWGIYWLGVYIEKEESSQNSTKLKKNIGQVQKRELKKPNVKDVLLFQLPWIVLNGIKKGFGSRSSKKDV